MLKYLLPGLAVAFVAAFGIFYYSSVLSRDPVVAPSGRAVQVATLMRLAEGACLSGKRLSGKAGIGGVIDKLSGKGDAYVQLDDLKGAVDVVNETLKLQENAEIRPCMQKYVDQIFQVLISDMSPRQLDLRFSLAFADPDNPLYDPAAIYIGEKYTSSQDYYVAPDRRLSPPVYVWPHILMPSRQRPYSAILHRVVRDANLGSSGGSSKGTEICLVDGASPPTASNPFAVLECEESAGQCKLKKPDDPGWVNFCTPERAASLTLPILISSAHAEEPASKVWNVPSLETLSARKDLRGIGYTKFEITAPSLPGEKIDGVVLGLKVNGTAVHIDGVDPEYRTLAYKPSQGLKVQFALQNLDFAGVNSGCDTIEASIQPVSNGRISGPSIVLKRPYVPLRDAESWSVRVAEREFAWTGTYVRPDDAYDYEVLVNSIELSDLTSKQQLDNARQRVNTAKRQVDGMNLNFRSMRVVGVVRPPLTKASFGTALGVITPTGQIQFTFDIDTARRFKASVVADAERIPNGSKVIRSDTFVYPLNKEVEAPKGICAIPDR